MQAVAIRPRAVAVLHLLGCVYLGAGNATAAVAQLQEAVRLTGVIESSGRATRGGAWGTFRDVPRGLVVCAPARDCPLLTPADVVTECAINGTRSGSICYRTGCTASSNSRRARDGDEAGGDGGESSERTRIGKLSPHFNSSDSHQRAAAGGADDARGVGDATALLADLGLALQVVGRTGDASVYLSKAVASGTPCVRARALQ